MQVRGIDSNTPNALLAAIALVTDRVGGGSSAAQEESSPRRIDPPSSRPLRPRPDRSRRLGGPGSRRVQTLPAPLPRVRARPRSHPRPRLDIDLEPDFFGDGSSLPRRRRPRDGRAGAHRSSDDRHDRCRRSIPTPPRASPRPTDPIVADATSELVSRSRPSWPPVAPSSRSRRLSSRGEGAGDLELQSGASSAGPPGGALRSFRNPSWTKKRAELASSSRRSHGRSGGRRSRRQRAKPRASRWPERPIAARAAIGAGIDGCPAPQSTVGFGGRRQSQPPFRTARTPTPRSAWLPVPPADLSAGETSAASGVDGRVRALTRRFIRLSLGRLAW